MSRADPQIKIRLPSDTKAAIKTAADANQRSMNAEIALRLQATLKAESGKQECAVTEEILKRIFEGIGQLSAEQIEVLRTLCSSLEKKK